MVQQRDVNWILLRGLGRELEHWGDFLDRFQQAAGSDHTHCIDIPGNGQFYQHPSPLGIAEYAEHVIAQAQHIEAPIGLVGLSLGGMIAIELAQKLAPDRVKFCVVINTSTGFNLPYQRAKISALPYALKLVLKFSAESREKQVLSFVSNLQADNQELLQHWTSVRRARPVSLVNIIRQLLAAARYKPAIDKPDCQGLLLCCDKDKLVEVACTTRLQQLWGWPVYIHPTGGHDLPLDDPDWIIDKIRAERFL